MNEALAEELESNSKVFVLGEEVAQYNGALVFPFNVPRLPNKLLVELLTR